MQGILWEKRIDKSIINEIIQMEDANGCIIRKSY